MELFNEGEKLEDYSGDFPFHVVFHDIQDGQVKEMEVTEEAYKQTIKTFKNDNNVSENVMFKYMSKHETVTPKPYFNED